MEQSENLEELYQGSGATLCQRFRKELGILLIKEREKKGLSVDELCDLLTLQTEVVSDLERGQRRTNWGTLCRLLDFYGKWLTVQFEDMIFPKFGL